MDTDTQKMMETYQKLATPSEPHRMLSRWAGDWDIRIKSWESPDQPPKELKGTAHGKMILGGRYLHEEVSGEMMNQPFNGIEICGFDNNTQKYQTVWFDDMSTTIMFLEGAATDSRTVTQTGHVEDPMQGPMDVRAVTTMIDDNTLGFEMYGTDKTGKEQKWMEMVYTRK